MDGLTEPADREPPPLKPQLEPPLEQVQPGYRHVLRVRTALSWLVFAVGIAAVDRIVLENWAIQGWPTGAAVTLGVLASWIAPNRAYARLRYRLTDRLLQLLRGWAFHVDTIVPLVRVQHLDVVRGPLDKIFGTASLVVHTAGTHNSIVTVPGLSPERTAEMRDAIREHVRTDFE